jgi:hypothetical protein
MKPHTSNTVSNSILVILHSSGRLSGLLASSWTLDVIPPTGPFCRQFQNVTKKCSDCCVKIPGVHSSSLVEQIRLSAVDRMDSIQFDLFHWRETTHQDTTYRLGGSTDDYECINMLLCLFLFKRRRILLARDSVWNISNNCFYLIKCIDK